MTNDTKFENSVHITGYVGKNPELRVFPSKKRLTSFSIAISQPVRSGQQPKKPLWLAIEAWDELSDRVQAVAFGKGALITVFGALSPNIYEQNIGDRTVEFQKVKVKLADFELIKKKQAESESSSAAPEEPLYPQSSSAPIAVIEASDSATEQQPPQEATAQFRRPRIRRSQKTA